METSPSQIGGGTMQAAVEAADMRQEVDAFLSVYANRPIQQNIGGMHINHSFATWFVLKHLKPQTVIESGVYRGHSTWLIEQACPEAKLFCLDLDFSHLVYRSAKATYLNKDFSECAWPETDPAETVCFFDDHQNAYQRLKDLRWAGFARAIFEDNFPCGEGDCYTLRHMLSGFGHERLQMSKMHLGSWRRRRKRERLEKTLWSIGARQQCLVRANTEDRALFARNCAEYFEFPPVALIRLTDWGGPYEGHYAGKPPIFLEHGMPEQLSAVFSDNPDEFGYSYIAYVELSRS